MVFGGGPVATRSAADFRMMRETLGLSQAWVASMVGVSTLKVAHWEDPHEFALPRREAWELVEGMWAEADRRASAFVDMASRAVSMARGNGIDPQPVMLPYRWDAKGRGLGRDDREVVVAGVRLDRFGVMRLENTVCRMTVDRLHALGVPVTVAYAEDDVE